MCERLLNLQEIYVSGQNICIEVYENSVGTITPLTHMKRKSEVDSQGINTFKTGRWLNKDFALHMHISTMLNFG